MLPEGGLGQPNQLDTAEDSGVTCWAVELRHPCEGGYKMIESIEIRNFRCFDRVNIEDLKTVNLLVGRNGSGKTAFLEALYFTLGSPGLAFKLRTWRGMGTQFQYSEYAESRTALWRDLFHQFEQNRVVRIAFEGSDELTRAVEITCEKRQSQLITGTKKGTPDLVTTVQPITFRYSKGQRPLATVKPDFSAGGEILFRDTPQPARGAFFPSVIPIDPAETAANFSSLSKQGKVDDIITALQKPFPMVRGLSLEMNSTLPMVYAEIEGLREKIPLGLVSTGLIRLVAYLVAIANQRGGVVIIDEIENGFYYDAMPEIWGILREFCERHDVQLFASTHSAECLKALQPTVSKHEAEFSLLRTVREDGRSVIRHFPGNQFLAALEEEIEVR